MKKWATAILLFDLVAGLFFLGVWEERENESAVLGVSTFEVENNVIQDQTEEVKKIALTFDDEVIIGLSQEISYIRSRFYDLVLF